ncbi:hypothetical protein JTE90_019514 [Oedothorax gibbosus]|uniref:Uncharacterized protein n=1 Tax=Oedothorax gibbosus TaxID=931172 RepID=A0AAV6VFE6_9ARAC|nr:hypothetical protein JTE90_019514 [Oedothorax gibbosus]
MPPSRHPVSPVPVEGRRIPRHIHPKNIGSPSLRPSQPLSLKPKLLPPFLHSDGSENNKKTRQLFRKESQSMVAK